MKGTAEKPTTPPEAIAAWEISDAKAKSDLSLAISPSEPRQVKNCTTSKEIRDKLRNVYESVDPARKATLLKSLILMKIKNCEHSGTRAKFFRRL